MKNYRTYNEETDSFTLERRYWRNLKHLEIRTIKSLWEEGRKQQQSIDIYNNLMYWIKHEETQHPEQLIMAKVLKDRNETELLYSLVVNA